MVQRLQVCAVVSSLCGGWGYFVICTINTASHAIKGFLIESYCHRFHVNPISEQTITMLWTLCSASGYLGAIFGSSFIGCSMERLGRRDAALTLNGCLVLISSVLCFFSRYANSFEMLYAGLFLTGINCGLLATIPIFMAECSRDTNRGSIGSISTAVIYFNAVLGYFFGQPGILGSEYYWHYVYVIGFATGICAICLRWILPESPKYTFIKLKNEPKARAALRFYQKTEENVIDEQIQEYVREDHLTRSLPTVAWCQILRESHLRRSFFLTLMVVMVIDIIGIDFVTMYSTTILESLGFDNAIAATITVVIYACATFGMFPFALYGVENIGRRRPLIISVAGGTLANILLMTENSVASVIALVLLVFAHHCVLTQIAHLIPAEVCAQSVRSKITAVSWTTNWIFSTMVVLFFEILYELIHAFVYLFFAILSLFFAVWFWFYLPETKQKPVDQIVLHLTDGEVQDDHFLLNVNEPPNYGTIDN